MWGLFWQGFLLGGGLIMAVGAQGVFVLSQGIKRNFPLTVALVCTLCDVVLIGLGVTQVGAFVQKDPIILKAATWGGVAFLGWYGLMAFIKAARGGCLGASDQPDRSRKAVIWATLAVTLLNPHVYLDTLFLLGSLSGRLPSDGRFAFGSGAVLASCLWFLGLSLGGGALANFFRKVWAWRILNTLVGITMWCIMGSLLMQNLKV